MSAERSRRYITVLAFCLVLYESAAVYESGDVRRTRSRTWEVNNCTAPDGSAGICKLITDCPSVRGMVNRTPLNTSSQASRPGLCGFMRNTPVVCCPLKTTHSIPTKSPSGNENSTQSAERNAKMSLLPTFDQCGEDDNSRISTGANPFLGELPWMALLQYRNPHQGNMSFHCGGVLISNRYILTAAHCVRPSNNLILVSVRLGEHDMSKHPDCELDFCNHDLIDIPIEKTIEHGGYSKSDRNRYNDIALLRLQQKVNFGDFVRPICLPIGEMKNKLYPGKNFNVAGWGKTADRSESDVKHKGTTRIINVEECRHAYENVSDVRINGDLQICASPSQKGFDDVCRYGDSGGALIGLKIFHDRVPTFVRGIMAFDFTTCGQSHALPGVFTRVSHYEDWILDSIEP